MDNVDQQHKQARYSDEERAFIVTSFNSFSIAPNQAEKTRRAFQKKFPRRKAPHVSTIYTIVNKFETNATVSNLHKGRSGRPRTVLTDENMNLIAEALAQDREVPFDRQVNTGRRNLLDISQSSWSRAVQELDLRCYRY